MMMWIVVYWREFLCAFIFFWREKCRPSLEGFICYPKCIVSERDEGREKRSRAIPLFQSSREFERFLGSFLPESYRGKTIDE